MAKYSLFTQTLSLQPLILFLILIQFIDQVRNVFNPWWVKLVLKCGIIYKNSLRVCAFFRPQQRKNIQNLCRERQ